ncbi:MAG: hypothetical protein JOZ54_04390 [Acidobacteria bacterium]|nr:hypothetical protein [Acidobacteriota bacterium]
MTMLALLDESAPETVQGVHYVISTVVIVDDQELAPVRASVSAVTADRPKHPVFHWSSEGVEKREKMIDQVCSFCDGIYTVIHHPVKPKQQVAARRAGLRVLLEILADNGIATLWIESRGAQDQADRQVILDAQRDGALPAQFSYSFRTKSESLLWLPDAAAGAQSDAETGKGDQYALRLQSGVAEGDVRRLNP